MAGGEKLHTPEEIRGYAELLQRNAEHFAPIKEYATEQGGDVEGFQCVLLAPLIPIVMAVSAFYNEVVEVGEEKLTKVADATNGAADRYEKAETANREILVEIERLVGALSEGKK